MHLHAMKTQSLKQMMAHNDTQSDMYVNLLLQICQLLSGAVTKITWYNLGATVSQCLNSQYICHIPPSWSSYGVLL